MSGTVTYRMPEQENIWESFQLIMHRLRNFVDAPYLEGPDIFGVEDNSQLFCLREGLVNFCAHSDYFAPAHPTIRVFDDRIVMQNPGRFILAADDGHNQIIPSSEVVGKRRIWNRQDIRMGEINRKIRHI
jgi:hypothetical protein